MRETNSSRRAVYVKAEALETALGDELRAQGIVRINRRALADRLDVPYGTYWRQTIALGPKTKGRPRQAASPEFIAAVVNHFSERTNPFADFFEVEGAKELAAA